MQIYGGFEGVSFNCALVGLVIHHDPCILRIRFPTRGRLNPFCSGSNNG